MKRLYAAFIALSEFMLLCIGHVLMLGASGLIIVIYPIMELGMKLTKRKIRREEMLRYMNEDKFIE